MSHRFAVFLTLCAMAWAAGSVMAQDPPATPVAADAAATPPAVATAETAPAPPKTPEERIAELEAAQATNKIVYDTLFTLVAGMLVFFMNLGFGCVESGMCRAKNCVNILSKNFIVFAVTTAAFWGVGFGLMFGNGNPYVGTDGLFALSGTVESYSALSWTVVPLSCKFFFQLVFAGTAATIVSGAVAERIKYHSFIVFSVFMAVLIYPIVGHWIWGGGWLGVMGFHDFAGSTQVHSIGGWAALTGVLILGPRIGKYGSDGKPRAIPGHNMLAATIGCFVLWLGWFGFNPGSVMGANPDAICHIALTTNTAAAIATLTATATAWILLGKPDLGMTLNGSLAGLVAITAPCAVVSVPVSALIGAMAGVIVVLSVIAFDRIKVDDPVGATSVHLVNGVFATICVGLFASPEVAKITGAVLKPGLFYGGGMEQLMIQLTGIGATAAYVLVVSSICWLALKYTMGIRVSPEEETEGLDIGEHGNEAYHGFVMSPVTS